MHGKHSWIAGSKKVEADTVGISVAGVGYVVGGTLCNAEILRLADENEDLRRRLEESGKVARREQRAITRRGLLDLLDQGSNGVWGLSREDVDHICPEGEGQ